MNLKNLKILADYLEALPETYQGFDMGVFCRDEHGEHVEPSAAECGTSMCAVGHGPAAGFAVDPEKDEDWPKYAQRHFGSLQNGWGSDAMQWCFAGPWDSTFPSIKDAVSRIRYLIAHDGTPPAWFIANADPW